MKISTLKLSGLATAIAMVATITACQNKDGKDAANTTKTGVTAPTGAEKIVYINSDSLLTKYQYFVDLKSRLDEKSKNAENDMAAKSQSFQREVAQYQQQQSSLPADQRAATEERLARKQKELQTYQQNAGAALQNEQATEQEKLYNKVAEYLKGYATTKGYKMVLTYAKGNSAILFADASLDVTTEVIKGLNEEYKAKK